MTNRVAKIQRALLDETEQNVAMALERDDGATVLLEFTPALIAELVGLAGMASEILSGDGQFLPAEGVTKLVGLSASPMPDNSGILIRFEDEDGFLHDFKADDNKCFSLRLQLRRALDTLRKERTKDATGDAPSIKLAVSNIE